MLRGFEINNVPRWKRLVVREKIVVLCAITGLLLSLVTVGMSIHHSSPSTMPPPEQVVHAAAAPSQQVALLVPEMIIPQGTRLNSPDVAWKQVVWPESQVPKQAIINKADLADGWALVDLAAGLPVLKSQIAAQESEDTLIVSPGMRAVSLEVDATSSLEGYAKPGSRVDVVLTYRAEDRKMTSNIIVENARVLSYQGSTRTLDARKLLSSSAALSRTLTLEVSTEDALKVQTARQLGHISLLMRNKDDSRAVEHREVSSSAFSQAPKTETAASALAQPQCVRGKMKIGGHDYAVDCDGELKEIEKR